MNILDEDPNWKTSPPRFRRFCILFLMIACVVIMGVIVITHYPVSTAFAVCYTSLISTLALVMGFYTAERGKQDRLMDEVKFGSQLEDAIKAFPFLKPIIDKLSEKVGEGIHDEEDQEIKEDELK